MVVLLALFFCGPLRLYLLVPEQIADAISHAASGYTLAGRAN
jgi:hypothetical protein